MSSEQHLSYSATGDVVVLDGDGSRWVREGEAPCPIWAEGILVPVDRDGNVVPLATKAIYDDDGAELTVRGFEFKSGGSNKGWTVFCALAQNSMAQPYGLQELHLHRPDSWGCLADDLMRYDDTKVMCEYFGVRSDETCDSCRAHRLRAHYPGHSCLALALDDVSRRVKALAGMGECE